MKIYIGRGHFYIKFNDEDLFLYQINKWPIYHCSAVFRSDCVDLSRYQLISNQETTNLIYESLINMSNSFDNGQYYKLNGQVVQLIKNNLYDLPEIVPEFNLNDGNDASKLVKLNMILDNIIGSVYENIYNN